MHSSIISDFQYVAKCFHESYIADGYVIGPTGHKYSIDDTNRSFYPNYLQSYEFAILSKATLSTFQSFNQGSIKVLKKNVDVELLGHFHDGNVVMVNAERAQEFLTLFQENVELTGTKLGLKYKQKVECKRVYPQHSILYSKIF